MKHKLRIEELTVDSFEATPVLPHRLGTVQANQSDPNTCYPVICASGKESCLGTCIADPTCGMSCDGTCVPVACTTTEA